jgi:structure-specific recognition protein 1
MERTNNNTNNNNNIKPTSNQILKGWSWGDIKIAGNHIEFGVGNQEWFNIPFGSISNALLPTKNEIGLEFNIDDEDQR